MKNTKHSWYADNDDGDSWRYNKKGTQSRASPVKSDSYNEQNNRNDNNGTSIVARRDGELRLE